MKGLGLQPDPWIVAPSPRPASKVAHPPPATVPNSAKAKAKMAKALGLQPNARFGALPADKLSPGELSPGKLPAAKPLKNAVGVRRAEPAGRARLG